MNASKALVAKLMKWRRLPRRWRIKAQPLREQIRVRTSGQAQLFQAGTVAAQERRAAFAMGEQFVHAMTAAAAQFGTREHASQRGGLVCVAALRACGVGADMHAVQTAEQHVRAAGEKNLPVGLSAREGHDSQQAIQCSDRLGSIAEDTLREARKLAGLAHDAGG